MLFENRLDTLTISQDENTKQMSETMEIFYDALQFDDRKPKDLYHEPHYADILKQWVTGSSLTEYEKKITASILIFYPEYILRNGKTEESIELLKEYVNNPDLQNQLNPERGLILYTVFFLLLKKRRMKESLEVLNTLETFFVSHCNGSASTKSYSETDYINRSSISTFLKLPLNIENAYTSILTLIMDLREILSLKSGFNISKLPGLPVKRLSSFEGTGYRGQALEFYLNEENDRASDIYHKLLISKFELPGTLVHLARVELSIGNMDQTVIFIINAWRIRHEAPTYVLVRILYFILLLDMARLNRLDIWVGCLKHVLNQPDCKMQWDMDWVLSKYEKVFTSQNLSLLKTLLEVVSGNTEELKLNKFELWQNAAPIPYDAWSGFDIGI